MSCLKTFSYILPMIYQLFIAVVVVSYLCIYISCGQLTCIVELVSTGNGQIIETLDSIEIKLCWLHCKNISCIFHSFVCLCCVVPVSTHYRLFSNSLYGSTAECKTVRVSKRTDCWCAFSWHICNEMAT